MAESISSLTQSELKRWLDYDPNTGIFRWNITRHVVYERTRQGIVQQIHNTHMCITAGDIAGSVDHTGYRAITIPNYRAGVAHRLAWLYVFGYFPRQLDHINEVKDDNRISNLREATTGQNNRNRGKTRDNASGYKGVSWDKRRRKYTAVCGVDGKNHYLGSFNDPESAYKAYCDVASQHHGEFFHG